MESLRIYISGAHSTGKTTVIHDLLPYLPGVRVEVETARRIINSHGWRRDDFHPDRSPELFEQLNREILLANIELEKENFVAQRGLGFFVFIVFFCSCFFFSCRTAVWEFWIGRIYMRNKSSLRIFFNMNKSINRQIGTVYYNLKTVSASEQDFI